MKKWIRKTGTALLALWLLLPVPVLAAGKDSITLETKDGQSAAVWINAADASEEKIMSVAVQLNVTVTEGEADISFEFAEGIPADVTGSHYEEGILSIYAASAETPLFDGEKMSDGKGILLGNVVMTAKTKVTRVKVEAAAGEDGFVFETVNSVYGKKDHIIEQVPEGIYLQTGGSSIPDGAEKPDENGQPDGGEKPDSNETPDSHETPDEEGESGGQTSGGSGNGSSNIQEGLNDAVTQQVTNPDDAVKIPAAVVPGVPGSVPLPDLSQPEKGWTAAGKIPGGKDKVTVVKPENGPSSIIVEEEKDVAAAEKDGTEQGDGEEILQEDGTVSSGKNEIALDQEKGGAMQESESPETIPVIAGAAAIVTGAAAGGFLMWKKKNSKSRKKRRQKRKK